MSTNSKSALSSFLTTHPSRRDLVRVLAGAGLSLSLLHQVDRGEAKKKRKQKNKSKSKNKNKNENEIDKAGDTPLPPNPTGEEAGCAGSVIVDGVCRRCDVCASGCGFTTVQAAIDAANAGVTIAICPGVFTENLNIVKDVRLVGAGGTGASATVLQGTGATSVVKTKTATVVLQNLRITGGRGDGSGIFNQGATLKVIGCTVSGNTDSSASGGGIYNAGVLDLIESTVSANEAASGGGIYTIDGNARVQLTDSDIRGNAANEGGGLFVLDGAGVRFDADSRVTENTARTAGGGAFVSKTAGRVSLVNTMNISGNTPTDCAGAAVDLCSGIVTRR